MGEVKDKLSWGGNFCRGILCCFNFLFLACGLILLGLAVWVLVDSNSKYLAFLLTSDVNRDAAIVLLVAALTVLVVSVFGFCGAKMENKCCLGMYIIFLVIIFIIELVAGCIALYYYVKADVEADLTKTLKFSYGVNGTGNAAITEAWDFFQNNLECCGVTGNASTAIQAYSESMWYANQTAVPKMAVPISCCRDATVATCQTAPTALNIWDVGCTMSVTSKVAQYGTVLGVIGIIVAIVQLMGLVCAVCLCKRL